MLVVGCGCRGRMLAATLVGAGHAVRGTTRDPAVLGEIEAAGAQAVRADPDLLATLTPHLEGISVLCWLMASATGTAEAVEALHGPRLESLLGTLVDTPVRGVVYERRGSVPRPLLERGAAAVMTAGETFRMPVAVVDHDPADHASWVAEAAGAVAEVLSV